jgi:WD40 repeat protein
MLQRLVLGQLPDTEAAALEAHLAGCPRCSEAITRVQGEDMLVEAMRGRGSPVAEADRPLAQQLIARLKHLPLPPLAASADQRSATTPADPHSNQTPPPQSGVPGLAQMRDAYDCLAPPQAPDEIGRLGGYRVLKVLGAGGMGVVFLAEDPQLQRRLALKAMKPSLAAGASAGERFLREARAMAAVRHDHIVTIHQVGEDRGVPFLAMEYLEGESLADRLHREGRLALAEVLRIGREVAVGLAAAHARGLVHRDVKPGNVWLEALGGRVKILDFGLVLPGADAAHLTQTGIIVGTPAYMAPEQARGEAVDARGDLYSLGCVLYRMAAGQAPFQGKDTMTVFVALATQQPRPPCQLNPEVPPALDDLILRLLEKDSARRPTSAQEVIAAIQAIEEALPPRPTPAPNRRPGAGVPWLARRLRVAAVLLAVLGGAAFLAASVVLRLAAGKAELVIETDDPAVEVTIKHPDGHPEVVVVDRRQKRRLLLQPGDYEIKVTDHGGLRFATRKLTLTRGGREILKAELILARAEQPPALVLPELAPVETVLGDGRLAHWDWVNTVAVSPSGAWIASGSLDSTAKVWDAATGRERCILKARVGSEIRCVAFHPQGKVVATGASSNLVQLWDAATGEELHHLRMGQVVHTVAFRPDGKILAAMSREALQLWDAATGKEERTIALRDGLEAIGGAFAWSPDGKTLAVRAEGAGVRLYDGATGQERRVYPIPGKVISCVAWSPDGKVLAAGCRGEHGKDAAKRGGAVVTLLDAQTGKEQATLAPDPAGGDVLALAFRRDGSRLAAAFDEVGSGGMQAWLPGKVCQWDLPGYQRGVTLLPGPSGWAGFVAVVFSVDGQSLITGSRDMLVRRWNAITGVESPSPRGAVPFLQGLALAGDNRTLACGSYDRAVHVFDHVTKEERLTLRGEDRVVWAVALSPDGRTLASAEDDNWVRLWDLTTGKEVRALRASADHLAFHPSGQLLAAWVWEGQPPTLWDVRTGEERTKLHDAGSGQTRNCAFSPDGTTLAASFQDRPVLLWDVSTGKKKRQLASLPGGRNDGASGLAFSPDGKTLVVGHEGPSNPIWLWDVATGEPRRCLAEGDRSLDGVAFSPDGKTLAAATWFDYLVRLWDPATGRPLRTFTFASRAPSWGRGVGHHLAFTADGRRLACCNANGTIAILDLTRPRAP